MRRRAPYRTGWAFQRPLKPRGSLSESPRRLPSFSQEASESSEASHDVSVSSLESRVDSEQLFLEQAADYLERNQLAKSSGYMQLLLRLHLSLQHFNGTILCGAVQVGKSTLLRCAPLVSVSS